MHRLIILSLGLLLVLSNACTKNGANGPQGPAGAQGTVGPVGPAGAANVIYSGWNYATNIRDTILDESELTIANLQANELTSTYLSTATILVYFTFDGSTGFPLPYTSYAGGKGSTISFIPVAGQILITRFTLDNSNSIPLGSVNQYRWVIIPGGVSVPDSMDYKTLSHFYGIPVN